MAGCALTANQLDTMARVAALSDIRELHVVEYTELRLEHGKTHALRVLRQKYPGQWWVLKSGWAAHFKKLHGYVDKRPEANRREWAKRRGEVQRNNRFVSWEDDEQLVGNAIPR